MTLQRRCNDVDATLCVCWVVMGIVFYQHNSSWVIVITSLKIPNDAKKNLMAWKKNPRDAINTDIKILPA